MLKYLAEWCSTMSAAFFVAAFLQQGSRLLCLILSGVTLGFGVYLYKRGGKNGY